MHRLFLLLTIAVPCVRASRGAKCMLQHNLDIIGGDVGSQALESEAECCTFTNAHGPTSCRHRVCANACLPSHPTLHTSLTPLQAGRATSATTARQPCSAQTITGAGLNRTPVRSRLPHLSTSLSLRSASTYRTNTTPKLRQSRPRLTRCGRHLPIAGRVTCVGLQS